MLLFGFLRHRLRFSLLTLFLVITIANLAIGWWVSHLHDVYDGYCPVALNRQHRWVKGDRAISVTYNSGKYYFATEEARQLFVANPSKYAAVYGGYDVVLAKDEGKTVAGERAHGVWYRERTYLFRDEESIHKFGKDPDAYCNPGRPVAFAPLW